MMANLFNSPRIAFLDALDTELVKHQSNLQRALDGTSAFYIPNGDQREKIAVEQARLDHVIAGVKIIRGFWQTKQPWQQLPQGPFTQEHVVLYAARSTTAVVLTQARECKTPHAHPAWTEEQLEALRALFIYLDTKLDQDVLPEKQQVVYSTSGKDIGYVLKSKSSAVINKN